MAKEIDHFLHPHPLVLNDCTETRQFKIPYDCGFCREKVHAVFKVPFYECTKCKYGIHESCARHPKEIQSFFHPCPLSLPIVTGRHSCDACFGRDYGPIYRCERCDFDMHVECAERPNVEGEELVQHFIHWHPLKLVDPNKLLKVECRICYKFFSVSDSDSFAYGCTEGYNFFIHKSCMTSIPQQINHFSHPSCPLILRTSLSRYECKGCDESGSDLAFSCTKCRFQLHVKCALTEDTIQHASHKHLLVLREIKEFDSEVRCKACGENCLLDPFFGCIKRSCHFFLHKKCADDLQPEIHHPFHPIHPLTLSSPPSLPIRDTFQCSSCLGSVDCNLLHYRCAKCHFNLHIDCAKPKLKIPVGHIHGLTYFDRICAPVQCNICHEDAQTAFFQCVACGFNIHIYCIPSTPKTITHDRHSHPLTVTKSPFEFEVISPRYADGPEDEFFCDVCEKNRYKFESVYYCADCKYIAEVRCVLSELLPSLMISKDRRTVEGKVVSIDEESSAIEATIENLKYKIAISKKKKKDLKGEMEKCRQNFKSFEDQFGQEKSELRKLKIDNFFYEYRLSHDVKKHEKSAEASTNLPSSSE